MKFGFRIPSLTKRISARTSWKRYVRHNLGFKAPRGLGIITNPKKAIYNKIYNKTSFGVDSILKSSKNKGSNNKYAGGSDGENGNFAIGCFFLILVIVFIINPIVGLVILLIRGIYQYSKLNSPTHKLNQKIKQAELLLESNKYQDIVELLKDEYNDGGNNEIDFLLGISYYGLEKYNKAIDPFQKIYETNPSNYDIGLRLAKCYYEIGKYDKTIQIVQKIPENFEKYIKVIQLQGLSFHKKGQTDIAIEIFKKAPLLKRNLNDDLLEVHYNLAILYKEINDIKNAIKHLKKVYAFDMNYRDVNILLEELKTK